MRDLLDFFVTERTENHARIVLAPRNGSRITQVVGSVRGPFSDFSKTLTADSIIKPGTAAGTFASLIVEPCYWTPRLPFWYDLRLTVTLDDGAPRQVVIPVAIKRFYCDQRNFLLEGKRVVLRGKRVDSLAGDDSKAAREYETALIATHVTEEMSVEADRLGVPLIVDLRAAEPAASLDLDWHPAVTLALIDAQQSAGIKLRNVLTAVFCDEANEQPTVPCDVYAIELQPGERPPAWAAACEKPVIAIRKDPEADIRTARAGCDKLQAELAPEFDLAGYFV